MIIWSTLFLFFFAWLTWRNFLYGYTLFLALLPAYLVRFSVGPLPTTLLELMLFVLLFFYILREKNWRKKIASLPKVYVILGLFFLLSATGGMFYGLDLKAAAGEWKAFYVEPVIFGLMTLLFFAERPKKDLYTALSGLCLGASLVASLAVIQRFTGWLVPYDFWEKNATYRVTGPYGFPNGVGLFLAPVLPIALALVQHNKAPLQKIGTALFIILSLLATLFAKSTGALVGIAVALFVLLLFIEKTRVAILILVAASLIALFSLPQLEGIQKEVTFQDRSGQIRLSMWQETGEFLQDYPLFGAGLASYTERMPHYHRQVNGEHIEIFHHPHNIFLTMWVNLGLAGLVTFIAMIASFFYQVWKQKKEPLVQVAALAMIIMLVSGLVDSPYIKNDLAILFWLIFSLPFLKKITEEKKNSHE